MKTIDTLKASQSTTRDQDITVYKSEDVLLTFTLDPAVDITDWTLIFTAKKSYASLDPLFFMSVDLSNPTVGEFQVTVSSANNSFATGVFVYDVTRTDPSNYTVLSTGRYIIKPGVKAS